MSKLFKVTSKQGNKVSTITIEAISWEAARIFCEAVTTQKVTEIQEVVYTNDTTPPVDTFDYFKSLTCIIKSNGKAWHLRLYNISKTMDEQKIYSLIRQHLRVDGSVIDDVFVPAFRY